MLDKIRGEVEDAGHQQHVCRQRVVTQCDAATEVL
jgi:hypothetical protein